LGKARPSRLLARLIRDIGKLILNVIVTKAIIERIIIYIHGLVSERSSGRFGARQPQWFGKVVVGQKDTCHLCSFSRDWAKRLARATPLTSKGPRLHRRH
jgi:hypothetical protein